TTALLVTLLIPWIGGGLTLLLRSRPYNQVARVALGSGVAMGLGLLVAWLWDRQNSAASVCVLQRAVPALSWRFRLDGLSLAYAANLVTVTLLAVWYAQGYLSHARHPAARYALLLFFAGSMLCALLADDVFLFLVFWEVMLIVSAALLLGWGEGPDVPAVTLRYFVYSQTGSLLLLGGIAYLVSVTGSTRPGEIAAAIDLVSPRSLSGVALASVVGFGVKMAIVPLHGWLPDAHSVAPMPVTIMLASAMLAMGAYGLMRYLLTILGLDALRPLQLALLVLGIVSQVHGALMSLASRDVKRIVAYSSVSQMGYILFGIGTLSALGMQGSLYHVIAHGVIKSLLFMAIGLVIYATETRCIGALGDLWQRQRAVMIALAVGAAALAGVPPLAAYLGEWRILSAGLASAYPIAGYMALFTPLLTAAYGIALVGRLALASPPVELSVSSVPRSMYASTLAAVSLVVAMGLASGVLEGWLGAAVSAALRAAL
ncbi:MAG: complex I subunit 5 family protein, partial [Anaerolineae bacterium]